MIEISFSVVYLQCWLAFMCGGCFASAGDEPGLFVTGIILALLAFVLPWLV